MRDYRRFEIFFVFSPSWLPFDSPFHSFTTSMWTVPGLPPLEVARRWRVMGACAVTFFSPAAPRLSGRLIVAVNIQLFFGRGPSADIRVLGFIVASPQFETEHLYIFFLLSLLSFAGEWVIRRQGGAWLRVQAGGEA